MLSRIYLVLGVLILAAYAWVEITGREFGETERQVVPADVRHSPGGYRTFHYWHSGYHGGK